MALKLLFVCLTVCFVTCVSIAVGLVVHDTYMTLFLASQLSIFVCLIVVMFLLF